MYLAQVDGYMKLGFARNLPTFKPKVDKAACRHAIST